MLNVGQHGVAVTFLALVHDIHETVIGDILPFFKTSVVKKAIEAIQRDILGHLLSKKIKHRTTI